MSAVKRESTPPGKPAPVMLEAMAKVPTGMLGPGFAIGVPCSGSAGQFLTGRLAI
jgi:hypothetical protein